MPDNNSKIMLNVSKKNFLYLLSLFLITFAKGLGLDSSSDIYKAVFYLTTLFILWNILKERWTKDEYKKLFIISVLLVLNFLFGKDITSIFSFVYLIGTKYVDIKSILKTLFWARFISFVSLITANACGLVESRVILFYRNEQFVVRSDLGFGHPNLAQSSFALLVLLFCYLYRKKINIVTCSILALCNYFLYQQTLSRTSFYLVILILILFFFEKFFQNIIQKMIKYTKYIQPILLVLTVVLVKLLYLPFVQRLDILFTGRLAYSAIALNYGVSLFGHPFSAVSALFDNSYSMILYNSGLILTILFMYAYYKTSESYIQKKDNATLILFIAISLLLFFESFYVNTLFNLLFFFIFKELVWKIRPSKLKK
ncbi:TPA: hypothetical protein ACHVEW_001927 [Streptococcus suis]